MNPFPKYNEKGELDTRLRVDPITGDVGIGTSKEKEHMKHDKTFEAINKLKEVELELHRLKNALEMTNRALETKDEPVGWIDSKGYMICVKTDESCRPLYTTPQRTWVGMTDEEKAQFVVAYYPSNWDRKTAVSLMNDYEKYLKEKNHV